MSLWATLTFFIGLRILAFEFYIDVINSDIIIKTIPPGGRIEDESYSDATRPPPLPIK